MRSPSGPRGSSVLVMVLLSAALAACVPLAAPVSQPASPAVEEARTVTMVVGPELVDCQGVGPQKCYQVKARAEDEYRLFYAPIEGFQYEPGYEYRIEVQVEAVANPPADASAYLYTLVDVVSKTAAVEAERETPAAKASKDPAAAVKNLEYLSEFTQSGKALLVDGEYREPAAPGSALETVVTFTGNMAAGDLNGDGTPDAAVVLATNTGGSGTFMDLAAVVVQRGAPVNVAVGSLGDRVKINSLAIQERTIVVDMITQGPHDPVCCPTQRVVQTYQLQGDQLVQLSSKVVGAAQTGGVPAAELAGPVRGWVGTTGMNGAGSSPSWREARCRSGLRTVGSILSQRTIYL